MHVCLVQVYVGELFFAKLMFGFLTDSTVTFAYFYMSNSISIHQVSPPVCWWLVVIA